MDFLVDLADYRLDDRVAGGKADPILIHVIYAQASQIYQHGRIISVDDDTYNKVKISRPNDLVNKFTKAYAANAKLLLHRKLADVLIDTAIDMRDRYGQFTVVMDGLRTCDSGLLLEQSRPDLVEAKLLARAGTSAHNRALAVDSKLFELIEKPPIMPKIITLDMLVEADEHGHLDDLNMTTSNRFYPIPTSDRAYINRLNRLQAWQRASVKNKLPIANLIAEFWDDRVTGSPSDMWRVLSCRAMCIVMDGNPKTSSNINDLKMQLDILHEQHSQNILTREQFLANAYAVFTTMWDRFFTPENKRKLEQLLGNNGGNPPALADFIFHEWLPNIYDNDLIRAGFSPQTIHSMVEPT